MINIALWPLFQFEHTHLLKSRKSCQSITICWLIEKVKTLSIFWLMACFSANKISQFKNIIHGIGAKLLSNRKRKDSLEGSSLDRVLFAAELEFLKILVSRLSQHTSNVNTECAGESEWPKQLYSIYLGSFLEHCIWICF